MISVSTHRSGGRQAVYSSTVSLLGFTVCFISNSLVFQHTLPAMWQNASAPTTPDCVVHVDVLGPRPGMCPGEPVRSDADHLICYEADPWNFAFVDPKSSVAFVTIAESLLQFPEYFHQHFLRTIVLDMLAIHHTTELRGLCVRAAGTVFLLCGETRLLQQIASHAGPGLELLGDPCVFLLHDAARPVVRAPQLHQSSGEVWTGKRACQRWHETGATASNLAGHQEAEIDFILRLDAHGTTNRMLPLCVSDIVPDVHSDLASQPARRQKRIDQLLKLEQAAIYGIGYRDAFTVIEALKGIANWSAGSTTRTGTRG